MAQVYFMDDRSSAIQDSLVAKMLTVFEAAGFQEMITPGKTVAIKMHMGEFNNTAYLRPVYVRALADKVKSLGGDPMIVDTTTLPYSPFASRTTAIDHYKTIERNGFNSATVGCPIVIADGYIGTDDVRVDLPEGFILKEQYVAMGVAAADVMIALSHFKGHPLGTFGGAVKNIGVGCASKRGKYNLHMGGHPKYGLNARPFMDNLCRGKNGCPTWMLCQTCCPEGSLTVTDDSIIWDRDKCRGCMSCLFAVALCGVGGFPDDFFDSSAAAIADSAKAAVKTFEEGAVGYINMAIDISPWCDCVNFSDRQIVPNIGVFASKDPVAIDVACIAKATESVGMPGSAAEERGVMQPGLPKFSTCASFLGVSEDIQTKVGEKNGLGEREYELVTVGQPESPLPFLYSPMPTAIKLGAIYHKKHPVPEQGFKRLEEVSLEEVR